MKKYLGYLIVLALGLAMGALIWSGDSKDTSLAEHDHDHEEGTIWTCSMHPQIRQNEPGKCPLCGMDLTPAGAESASDADPIYFEMTGNAMQLAGVQTELVQVVDNEDYRYISLNGRLNINKDREYAQVAHIPGRIERLYLAYEGQRIPAGAPIAEVYSPALIKAQEELRLAKKMDEATSAAAVAKLSQWKLTDEQIASIHRSEHPITTFTIYADQGGTVNEKKVNPGDYINRGQVLYQAVNLQSLWLEAEAYEQDLSALSIGQMLDFSLAGFPGQSFAGRIDYIDPFVDPVKRTAIVRATISNVEDKFKPDMLAAVKVQFRNNRVSGVLTIPVEAVLWTGARSVVYVQDANDASGLRFGLREVSLGEKLDSRYEVLDGLEAGERVVSKGTFSVDAAAQLAGKASMMNSARELLNWQAVEELPEWTNVKEQSSSGLKKGVYALVEAYLKLKDALVEARPAEAAKAALEMEKVRSTILLSDEPNAVLENREQLNAVIKSSTQGISRETNLDKQRQHFIMLSNSMIALVSSIGFEGPALYLQNCPMANNDQGADWLSLEENIRNPYFGSLMMTCGTVEDIFKN